MSVENPAQSQAGPRRAIEGASRGSPPEAPSVSTLGEVAVEAINVTKAYGATLALDEVSFQAFAGKVNVLLGENGAGKSTLMKILAGEVKPDAGRILCNGQDVHLRSPRDAHQHGIAIIHQELSLVSALTVADNIFLGQERRRGGLIKEKQQFSEADSLLSKLDERIDSRSKVSSLTVGQQQVVEIAKALIGDARVLIMDEPTSALSDSEVEALFGVVRELATRGVAIVYISHRMDEIFRIGDYLTVLRDGRRVASARAREVDMDWVFENMLGEKQRDALREVEARHSRRVSERPQGLPALHVEHLTVADPFKNRLVLDDVSFDLWPGEILGVYGLLGAGKTELAETISGHRRDAVGDVCVGGVSISKSIFRRMRAGIALVPEDRQRDALVQTTSIADNILLSSLDGVARSGLIATRRAISAVEEMITMLSIRLGAMGHSVMSLSGGNQQKVIIARALLTRPRILILDEPTRGIDVGAKAEVFRIIGRLAEEGLAVLFSSSDLSEVMGVADRILVLAKGRVRGIFDTGATKASDIARASNYDE